MERGTCSGFGAPLESSGEARGGRNATRILFKSRRGAKAYHALVRDGEDDVELVDILSLAAWLPSFSATPGLHNKIPA